MAQICVSDQQKEAMFPTNAQSLMSIKDETISSFLHKRFPTSVCAAAFFPLKFSFS